MPANVSPCVLLILVIAAVGFVIWMASRSTKRPKQRSPAPFGDSVLRSPSQRWINVSSSASAAQSVTKPAECWVAPGSSIEIAGRKIEGGMVFVGRGLRALSGHRIEPALIDPSLPVTFGRQVSDGAGMNYWPSYSDIGPEHRGAYLMWLATGRNDPSAYIGYVFLFFYGLERRLLDPEFPSPLEESAAVADEVERLLAVYPGSGSFQGYAGAFLENILLPVFPPDGFRNRHPNSLEDAVSRPPSGSPSNVLPPLGSRSRRNGPTHGAFRTPAPA